MKLTLRMAQGFFEQLSIKSGVLSFNNYSITASRVMYVHL